MRSGQAYLAGLRDERAVVLDGERVSDVTKQKELASAIQKVAELYDRRLDAAADWKLLDTARANRSASNG